MNTPRDACPGFLDNGAFGDWRAGRSFDEEAFGLDLVQVAAEGARPDFIVVPDVVAGGASSLALSRSWLKAVAAVGPAYLAVQDGMTESEVVEELAQGYAGIFVGGTLPWKLQTGLAWCLLGRRLSLPVHVGRVGTAQRVAWAKRIGVTSIDSCLPLWSRENLQRFVTAMGTQAQRTLGW